jgi:hydroxyethylthiazole kinase-like uncharacterized protein yjeF
MTTIDAGWRADHPLPVHLGEQNKNSRGRVLAVGGGMRVPGGLLLTAEAALRAGAGKVQMASIAALAVALGVAFPEAGVVALDADDAGEIAPGQALIDAAGRADAVVVGPGMSDPDAAARLVAALCTDPLADITLILDAAAVTCLGAFDRDLAPYRNRLILTPHLGEMAALLGREAEAIADDQPRYAAEVASRFRAVVALKGSETVVAAPDGTLLQYEGGGIGLGTGGSGDVLAGIITGLASRGADPLLATGWGVWTHGEAGRRLAADIGPMGFLARELLPVIPSLLPR